MIDVLKYWNLCDEKITPIDTVHKSAWDIGDKFILKRISDNDALLRNIHLINSLYSHNIPVAVYIKTVNGQWISDDGMYCLMKKLSGEHIDFYAQPDMIKELGRELAKLHMTLKTIESQVECNDNNYIDEWQNYIKAGLVNIPDEIIYFIETRFFELYKNLPRQLIHRDVHSQNMLLENGKLSGWLDFDISCRNIKMFDLAYLQKLMTRLWLKNGSCFIKIY